MDISNYYAEIAPFVIEYGASLAGAIIWLIVGRWIIVHLVSIIRKPLEKYVLDSSVRKFMLSFLSIFLKILLLISVASLLGLETTSLIAALGAAGIAIGLALQGSLSNFAGGLLILLFKPFSIGDYIKAQGEEGTVQSISVLYTVLATIDNKKVTIPNGNLANEVMTNNTAYHERKIEYKIGLAYSTDIKKAKELIRTSIEESGMQSENDDIFIGLHELANSSIIILVRYWCPTSNYLVAYHSVLESIKEKCDENDIAFPFPQLVVHQKTSQ